MTDIKLIEGDLGIYRTSGGVDLVPEDSESYLLFERAVRTPIRYITEFTLAEQGVNIIDQDFGNAIYEELSEALTLNWVASARSIIVNAISKVDLDRGINVQSVEVNVLDFNSVVININYTDLQQKSQLLQVPIVI